MRATPQAFTFQAFGPGLSLYDSKEHLLAESVIMALKKQGAPSQAAQLPQHPNVTVAFVPNIFSDDA